MGYLLHILIVLGAEGLGELDITTGWNLPWAVLGLAAVPHTLSSLARMFQIRGAFGRAAFVTRVLRWSAPLLQLLLVCVFGWVQSAREWTSAGMGVFTWPEPGLFLALAPYLVFELLAIDAQARVHDTRAPQQRALRSFQLRMFLSALLPIGLYFGLSGIVATNDALRVHVEQVALFNGLFMVVLLVLLALALPILMRNTWETVPIPDSPQRSVLERVAQRASFNARDLLIWRTGNLMANAAIVGVSGRSRVVLFSDSLLSVLSLRELASVFGHEMGHAMRHHVWIFIAWAMAFFLAADQAAQALAQESAWWVSAAVLGTLGMWALSFGWMSRRFELEADLFSLQLLDDPEGLISALERVGPRDREANGWRHFSTRRRVDFIVRAAGDPDWARRFRARLRRLAIAGIVAAAVAATFTVQGLISSFAEDRVWADLSLGRFEEASASAERVHAGRPDALDEEILGLARLAGRFVSIEGAGEPQIEDLERAVVGALKGGNLERALGYSKLAILRGARELHPLSRTLVALMANDSPAARENYEGVEAHWRVALAPWASTLVGP